MKADYHPAERTMVKALRDGRRTTRRLVQNTGVGKEEARKRLVRLEAAGVVERVDDPRATVEVWLLSESLYTK